MDTKSIEEFAKNAPKIPPHYEVCSFLKSQQWPGEGE
jgi:hypothetical protein